MSTPRGGANIDVHHAKKPSSSTTRRNYHCSNHHHHHHHPGRKENDYTPKEFKKAKPLTFDGDMMKVEDEKSWLLGMKKFFRIHNYSKNMKARVATYNLKGKTNIWWEDLKNVRAIVERELTWTKFEKLFTKQYLSEHYYDGNEKEFYELKMGPLLDEEYITKFLWL